jgi:hypothetical protein
MIGRGGGRFLAAFACAGLAAVLGLIAPAADADTTLAHWRFEPGANFLSDSSGNGYHLTGTAAETSDVANVAGGTGSASFNGTSHSLKTISPINYTGVAHVRISYAVRVANSAITVVLENSPNTGSYPGAFSCSANELAAGNGAAGYRTGNGGSSYNIDQLPHAYNNAGWDLYQVDIRPGLAASNVVVVTRNGVTLADSTAYGLHDTANAGFYNGVLFLGARNQAQYFLKGNLDEVKIESIEPTAGPVSNYWNTTSVAAQSFNTFGNWSQLFVPRAIDTAVFTNWGNTFALTFAAPVTNANVVIDAIGTTLEMRPGGAGSAAWTVTNSMRVGNSVANLAGVAIYNQQISVTNSSGTASLYVNWGVPGRGRIFQWDQNASLIADHIYASNHYAWAGLDVINVGTLTTRGDSEFAILAPATPTTFFMANWGGALATWNILGGTNRMAQDMNLGSPGVYGWGAAGACTAVVSVAGSTARLLAARAVTLGAAGAGLGLLTVSNGGYAQVSGLLRVGMSSGSYGNTVRVTGPNSKLKTDNQVYVYSYQPDNSIQIENGGTWEHNSSNALYFLGAGNSTNNRVVIDGPGSSFTYNDMFIGGGAGVQHGKGWLIIQNGARASTPDGWDHINVGYGTGATYGEIRVAGSGSEFLHGGGNFNVGVDGTGAVYLVDGGLLESGITVGANGKGLVMNNGGILQFFEVNPSITVSTPGRLVVTNGTISFRGVTTVDVNGNVSGTRLTNATFYGANAFRLNNATNAATGQNYTFDVTGDPRNYARLELFNRARYRGGNVTIGSGGTLAVSTGTSTLDGNLTLQPGAVYAVNAGTNASSGCLAVGGSVALGGATLQVSLNSKPAFNQAYPILLNAGTAPVPGMGNFSPSMMDVNFEGKTYTLVVRTGTGDGNDVAVTLANKGTVICIR